MKAILFGFDDYYPAGGADDIVAVFETSTDLVAAEAAATAFVTEHGDEKNYELVAVTEDLTWSVVARWRREGYGEDASFTREPIRTPDGGPRATPDFTKGGKVGFDG